jgi:hypothetical protein
MRSPARVPRPATRRPASQSRDRSRSNRVVRDYQAENRFRDELRDSRAKTIAPKSESPSGREGSIWSRSGPQEITCRDGRCWPTADLTKSVAT